MESSAVALQVVDHRLPLSIRNRGGAFERITPLLSSSPPFGFTD